MKKKELPPYKLYNIIPSQETVYLMVKYSFHKQLTQIPVSFTVDKDIDFDLLQKAFDIELERNDSLRIRFVVVDKKIKQYFLPSLTYKVPVKHFSSFEEQDAFFAKDAQKPVYFLKDETFRIYFYKTDGVGNGVYFNVSHLNMDAMGAVIFFMDLLKVYKALKKGEPMPEPLDKYEDYIQEEFVRLSDTKKMEKHKKFYTDYFLKGGEPFYAAVHGPEFLEKYRKKKKNPDLRVPPAYNPIYDKCAMITKHIEPEQAKKIFNYCLEKKIAPESILQLGLRTHCSAINNRIDDVFMMSMCSKRATKSEKNMSGCITQPLQLRTIIPENYTFSQAIDEMTSVRTKLFRHSTYPYITARDLSREIYNYNLIQGPACMMFSWIPVPIMPNLPFKVDFKTYDLGRYFTPLYTICSPDPKDMGININYMYRVKLSTAEDIEALHSNAMKVILAGIENPDVTIGELLDSIS
ncbi:MAG: condensation domain-containing protein [Acutalibacteraceae bacterium]